MLPENVVRCLSFDGLILFVVPPSGGYSACHEQATHSPVKAWDYKRIRNSRTINVTLQLLLPA